jgi:hypothetical protein
MSREPQTSFSGPGFSHHRGHVINVGYHDRAPLAAAALRKEHGTVLFADAIGPAMVTSVGMQASVV